MDIAAMEFYLNGNGSTAFDNRISFAENPSVYFRQFIPGNDGPEFLSEDWRLSGGGMEAAISGGWDLSGEFTHDADGATRSGAWSIGAYEF